MYTYVINYAYMPDNYVYMQDIYVDMQHNYVYGDLVSWEIYF